MEIQKIPESQSQLEKKMELEESTSLYLDYTTKLQSSRQYGTGTHTHKKGIIDQWNKIESAEKNTKYPWPTNL